MIKKSPRKYLFILLIIEFFFLFAACNRLITNYGEEDTLTFSAGELFCRAGTYTGEACLIDSTAVLPDSPEVYTGTFTYGPYIKTLKGSYSITLYYETDTDSNSCYAHSNTLTSSQLKTSYRVPLPQDQNSVTFTMVLTQGIEDLEIITEYGGEGFLRIDKMTMTKTMDYYIRNIVITVVLCLLGIIAYLFYVSELPTKKNILCVSLIVLASCYPLTVDYLIMGHDLPFHLSRIEGIAQGISQGIFPVKIHPFWANDHGYAVGVFYGDLLLYFPAALRNIGFSIQESYMAYIFLINLATVLISWKCFQRMLDSNKFGLLACLLYTLAPYRLSNVYLRSAVGEYTALTFLPLVMCGFYLIFTEDYNKKGYWKNFLLPALGLSGIIQCHVISCEMVGIFIIIACLFMLSRICVLKVFGTLCLAAFTTVLLNLGFLVPFLSYFGGDYVMNSPNWFSTPIQSAGAYPAQLFPVFQNGMGSSMVTANGIATEMPLGVGFTLFLGLLLFFYLLLNGTYVTEKGTLAKLTKLSAIMALLSLYMSTCLFPWNKLASFSDLLKTLVFNLQFPWRFLTIATLLLIVVTCASLKLYQKHFSKEKFLCVFTVLTCFFVISTAWFYYDFMNQGNVYRPYDSTDLNSMLLGSNEYLPTDTYLPALTETTPMPGDGIEVLHFEKKGTNIELNLTNQSLDSYVELPLLYYKGYAAVSNGKDLILKKGTNNVIRVEIPADFAGDISVFFREPLTWRIGEIVSAITVLGIIIGLLVTALVARNSKKTISS